MAENLQTTRPAEEGWTTVIRPRTGWFDIDLQELFSNPKHPRLKAFLSKML